MARRPVLQVQPQLTYVDRPEIAETYVDSLAAQSFDGNARLEFVVNRLVHPHAGETPKANSMTAVRLVIPLAGLIAMTSTLNGLVSQLQAAGVIQKVSTPQSSGSSERPN